MRKLSSNLYKAARTTNTLSAFLSGDSKRAGRRAKNIAVGRGLARAGFWRKFWGGR